MTDDQEQAPRPIAEIAEFVRDLVNKPRTHAALSKDNAAFNVLCSSLDAFEDTQLGIESYPVASRGVAGGALYLMIYGVLQMLYVQQDALGNMASSCGMNVQRDEQFFAIRTARNISIGHPTKTHKGTSHFIARNSMTAQGFRLMTVVPSQVASRVEYVSIVGLLQRQEGIARQTLLAVAGHLNELDRKHRALYMNQKLDDLFPSALGYSLGKIIEATRRSDLRQLGIIHVDIALETLGKFKKALEERDVLDAYDEARDSIDLIEWPLQRLRDFFSGETSSVVDRGAYIFASFCRERMEGLRKRAVEIDKEYSGEDSAEHM